MDTSVHFEKIAEEITKQLESADHGIVVAIAWFTDQSLFNVLRRKANSGVAVKLLYLDDKINNNASFNIRQLEGNKVQLYPIPSEENRQNLMHNKFCVVDGRHVITGSYNWTHRAKSNDENITVFADNPDIASQFLKAFDDLLEKYNHKKTIVKSREAIIPRLEVVKNFALMGEWDSAQTQLEKLRSFSELWDFGRLFSAIEKQDNQTVADWISTFIEARTSLVIHEDEDIPRLKIELQMFEFKTVALSAEKDELEDHLASFHLTTTRILGKLMVKHLKLVAELKQKRVDEVQSNPSEKEKMKIEAKQAWEEYKTYQVGCDEIKQRPVLSRLTDDDQRRLKVLYKKATQLCHPDTVSEGQRDMALDQFIHLKEAYDHNDIETVEAIYEDLFNNRPYTENAKTLSDSQSIKREIKRLENTCDRLLTEVFDLKSQIRGFGIDKIVDWDEYFVKQKQTLMDTIEQQEIELSHV
jgi:hypothetical protein